MINPFQWADIAAVKDYLAFELVPVLLDMVVLYEDDYHVHIVQELVEVVVLVLCDMMSFEERIIATKRTCEVAFLGLEHLECRRLAEVVDILLVGKSIETDLAVVGEAVLLHDFVDTVEHESRLAVVCLHGLVDHLCELRIVSYEEPRVD